MSKPIKFKNDLMPREYLSYSQMILWERSPELYKKIYLYGEDSYENEVMKLGREVAEMLELNKESENLAFEAVRQQIPHYHYREKELRVKIKLRGYQITLLGKLDCYSKAKIGEIKTGKLWTQKKADESGQITFYTLIFYLLYKKFPALWLHWIETKNKEITGRVEHFKTERNLPQLMRMMDRIALARIGIEKLVKEELKKL